MQTFLIILLIVLIIAVCTVGVLIYKKIGGSKNGDDKILNLQNLLVQLGESSKITREQIENVRKTFDEKLENSNKTVHGHLEKSIQTIKDITTQLENLKSTNKQILDLSGQIRGLEDVLKNPKQRGILGEYFLETLLKNLFVSEQYRMQYKIGRDEKIGQDLIVDAVVFFGKSIIPIDSKFSLENYNKLIEEKDPVKIVELEKKLKLDLQTRIDETSKYIRPDLNTTDFAFMFISAEGIYYDLLINKVGVLNVNSVNLIEYAFKKHVIIVSPTSFFAYLQTVLQGMRAMKMEENVEKVIKNVGQLNKHLASYDEYMKKLGNNLDTTVNAYNGAYKEFKKVDKDVLKITGKGGEVEVLEIEKTDVED
jgi:DNA recombination protein RmuC